jgi:hypothetical protein
MQRDVVRFLLVSLPLLSELRSTVSAPLSDLEHHCILNKLDGVFKASGEDSVAVAANLRSIECSNLVGNALDQLRFPALEVAGIPAYAELAVALCAEAPRLRELRLLGVLVHVPNAQARSPV